ncbi:LysR family transcriptional regulator [Pseudomonas umsongensis]|jgi:DNA-binding transcriptional LysR family regulator|uniref:LysR family transcriptional regulator n=1 Tax=Pseudomonas umsongensis TaxID=198618 RepID=UPI0015C0910F|nr:LysR family transcriptional regulator [Pseudomonas umsongensis]NWL19050.1 LysR family transcriptional regulator [Pseudomonas umsongensis]
MEASINAALALNDNQIRYLFLSHQLGSMRAAADHLGIAPSSVSRQINQLESILGIELVECGTHRIRLTTAGQAAVDYYRNRASEHEAFLNHLNELRNEQMGKTIIAIGEGIFSAPLIGMLDEFFKQHPGQHTEIVTAHTLEVQRIVTDDRAHIGVLFSPHDNAPLCRQFGIAQPLKAIVHPDHPFARQASISLEQLSTAHLVLPGQGYRVRELIDQACRGKSFSITSAITVNSLQVMLDLVQANRAITLLAEVLVTAQLRAGQLVAVAVDCPEMASTELQIVCRRGRKLSAIDFDLMRHLSHALNQLLRTP